MVPQNWTTIVIVEIFRLLAADCLLPENSIMPFLVSLPFVLLEMMDNRTGSLCHQESQKQLGKETRLFFLFVHLIR